MNLKLPIAQQWADEFSRKLRRRLTKRQMELAIARNRRQRNPDICHSHDFCDANVVMGDAFKKLTGVEPDETNPELTGIYMPGMDDAVGRLWAEAWTLAKRQEFKPSV